MNKLVGIQHFSQNTGVALEIHLTTPLLAHLEGTQSRIIKEKSKDPLMLQAGLKICVLENF